MIEHAIVDPTRSKSLRNGRRGFWLRHERLIVVVDPNSSDGGTAYGIKLPSFAAQVGMPRSRVPVILNDFEALMKGCSKNRRGLPAGDFVLNFSAIDTRAFHNALELVMREFGCKEFSTRTGFGLPYAAKMLDELNAALFAPLHIEREHSAPQEPQAASSR